MKLSVIVPCYNEKATIIKTIEEVEKLDIEKEIIVIDNYSNDGTRELLQRINREGVKVILHDRNYGVGFSTKEGISVSKGDLYYNPCADLEYKIDDVYKMLKKMQEEKLDVVFGSRLLERKNISKLRLIIERPYWLGSIIATTLINLLYRRRFTDVIATKLIKMDILKNLNIEADNQAFEFELVSWLCKKRCKIGEVPVWYRPRTHKEGKTIKALDIIPAIIQIFKVKFFG